MHCNSLSLRLASESDSLSGYALSRLLCCLSGCVWRISAQIKMPFHAAWCVSDSILKRVYTREHCDSQLKWPWPGAAAERKSSHAAGTILPWHSKRKGLNLAHDEGYEAEEQDRGGRDGARAAIGTSFTLDHLVSHSNFTGGDFLRHRKLFLSALP